MAQTLAPLPPPGFSLFPDYTATQPHTFVFEQTHSWRTKKPTHTISYASSDVKPKPTAPYLEVYEYRQGVIFRNMKGREAMCVEK